MGLLPDRRHGQMVYECRCDCGNTTQATGAALRRGDSQSCGCLNQENRSRANRKHGLALWHPLYSSWLNMRGRCNNPTHPRYADWGGRGITVCERWDDFAAFVADMGERPEGLTLDRIDNDGNYEPSNCRWATLVEQRANRRAMKLTVEQVREIRALSTSGLTRRKIGDLFGVSSPTITNIVLRRTWRDV